MSRRTLFSSIFCSLLIAGSSGLATAGTGERIESMCRAWTPTPCILKVAGSLRSARSGDPLHGRRLRFVAGDQIICTSVTDATGRASCLGVVPSGRLVAENGYRILFDGEGRFLSGSAASLPASQSHDPSF